MTDDEIKAIRDRLAKTGEPGMHSGCWDYACYCHFDLPKTLDEIDRLKAELREKDGGS